MNKKTLYLILTLVSLSVLVVGFLAQWFLQLDDDAISLWTRIRAWVGAICAFAIFSFILKENPIYRTFEHMLLGLGLGFSIAIVLRQMLIEKWWKPMSAAFVAIYNGTQTAQSYWDASLIFSAIFGLLWYCQYSKKYLWLSRLTIGVTAGAGAGMTIRRIAREMFPQITSTFKNISITDTMAPHLSFGSRIYYSAENFLFLLIVCCVLYYFFFSFRRDSALAKAPASLGRFFLMISFGAFFGNTFMTRVVILIERVNYLLSEWLFIR